MPKRKAAIAGEESRKKAKSGKTHSIPKFDLDWRMEGKTDSNGVGTLMVLAGDLAGADKIAGFDIDSTLIKTKSGRKFATGAKDWTWLYDCVPAKLKEYHKDGYRIVFFTNQAGIEKMKVAPTEIITKVNDMVEQLDIPCYCLVCTGQNEFRKPSTNMWDYLVDECNKTVEPTLASCVYVGDAAGRAAGWADGKPKDFSCSDRMFATNIGIDFKTPEEFFLEESPAPFRWNSIDPVKFLQKNKNLTAKGDYASKKKEMVIMVGPPASGKSTFVKQHLKPKGYGYVNRDTLKTQAKCLKAAEAILGEGKSVAIDNTNPSKAVRSEYVRLAQDAGVSVRCFIMDTPFELAHHLNYVRQTQTNGEVRRVPDVGYNMYKKNFEQPELDEGFTELVTVPFVPKFSTARHERIFKHWTTAGH